MSVNLRKLNKDIFNEDEDIRILALTTLIQLSPSAVESMDELDDLIDELRRAGENEEGDIRFLARKAYNHLCEIGRLAKGAVPAEDLVDVPKKKDRGALLAVLREKKSSREVASALSSLLNCGAPEDVSIVSPFLEDEDARVRSNAVEFIERHATRHEALKLLVPMMSDSNNRVKGTVATALGRIGHPQVVDYLRELLRSSRLRYRESAVYALANIKSPRVVDLLIEALRDPYEGIRLRAVEGLARQKDPRALVHLRPLLNDMDIDICEAARRAIAFISMEEAEGFAQGRLDVEGGMVVTTEVRQSSSGVEPITLAEGEELPPERLMSLLDDYYAQLGSIVFEKCAQGSVLHERLKLPYYEGLKVRAFLDSHKSSLKHPEPGDAALSDMVKRTDLNPSAEQTERQAVCKLEQKLRRQDAELGRLALELLEDRSIELDVSEDLLWRIRTLKGRLGKSS